MLAYETEASKGVIFKTQSLSRQALGVPEVASLFLSILCPNGTLVAIP